ncbi:DUF4239 domain-containing protein [Streptomyces sp. NPDC020719]|uniref:bestrophin-like domain n=1 Tax=Streptomyces sp. NPDC020719 TaxID=3154896 RepID=UPI0033F16E8A
MFGGPLQLWLLNHLSTLEIAAVVVGGLVIVAVAGGTLAHRRYPKLAEGEHNDMVGVLLGMFGAIYGIILAFVVVTLWTQMQDARSVVAAETTGLAQVVRDIRAFPPPEQRQLNTAVSGYVHRVVETQWPLMRAGKADYAATESRMDGIYTVLQSYEPATEREKAFYGQTVADLNGVVAQRRSRIAQSGQELPPLLQVLVYGGALLIIPFTFLYGNTSRRAQLFFVGSVAALIGFSLLLVLVLDRPFAGDLSVDPGPYRQGALAQFW